MADDRMNDFSSSMLRPSAWRLSVVSMVTIVVMVPFWHAHEGMVGEG